MTYSLSVVKYSIDSPASVGARVAVSVCGAGVVVGARRLVGDGPGVAVVGLRVGWGVGLGAGAVGTPLTGAAVGLGCSVGVSVGTNVTIDGWALPPQAASTIPSPITPSSDHRARRQGASVRIIMGPVSPLRFSLRGYHKMGH